MQETLVQFLGREDPLEDRITLQCSWASLVAQTVKNLPAVQETWVPSLVWENSLEKGMQPTPVFLPGKSHGQRSLACYSPRGHKELSNSL